MSNALKPGDKLTRACQSCQHRKKKCDKSWPRCALCTKYNETCEYTSPPKLANPSLQDSHTPTHGTNYLPGEFGHGLSSYKSPIMDLAHDTARETLMYPTPQDVSSSPLCESLPRRFSEAPSPLSPMSPQTGLPSQHDMLALVNYFFEHCHDLLPVFDFDDVMNEIQAHLLTFEYAPPLIYVILTAVSTCHPSSTIRQGKVVWMEGLREATQQWGYIHFPTLRSLQCILWSVFLFYKSSEVQVAWMALGNAWRMACSLGLNTLDATETSLDVSRGYSQGREEVRRALWSILILDASLFRPCMRQTAIDERVFSVNAPTEDQSIRQSTVSTQSENLKIERKTKQRQNSPKISKRSPHTRSGSFSLPLHPGGSMQLDSSGSILCEAHALLWSIWQFAKAPRTEHDTSHSSQMAGFQARLSQIRLQMPQSAFQLPQPSHRRAFWLVALLDGITILLNYESLDKTNKEQRPPTSKSDKSAPGLGDFDPNFSRGVVAASHAVRLVEDALMVSTAPLLNPHLAPIWFLCCRVKVLSWMQSSDPSPRSEVNTLLAALELLQNEYAPITKVYRDAVLSDLAAEPAELWSIRQGGLRALCQQSTEWLFQGTSLS